MDGTPIVDIKLYLNYADSFQCAGQGYFILETLLSRVELYRQLGRNEEALEDLSGFLAIKPDSAAVLGCREDVYRQLGRLE